MHNKIVDMVAVTSRNKPLSGGKCEKWWREWTTTKRGIKKVGTNRTFAGKDKDTELSPSISETLQECQFKGFEFGQWLSQAERYDVFVAFQTCLADMHSWLGTKNFGFDHNIGVAFGARGSRGALAHYEPWSNIINMTKQKGAGSFLHEYAHAIDYSVGGFFDQCNKYVALSGGHTMVQTTDNVGGQFRAMINKILIYARDTESYKKMAKIPAFMMKLGYWGNSTEMFARLTETYFSYYYNKGNNYYLVKPSEYYEKRSKEYGMYLSRAEMDVLKPEIDKFWKEVALLLNNKCTLKKTPFPVVKIKPKNEKKENKEATADTVSQIVQEQAKALKKKNVKSNFKNKYRLLLRVSQGTGSSYTVLMEQKLPSLEFNAHERREFSVMLKEALTKAGIKVTASEVGGNDGRPVYYLIRAKHLHDTPKNAYVDMSISFVDANSEEKKDKPKVMEPPKEFVVGCTYIPHNGKISDKKWHITVIERNGVSIKYKYQGKIEERKIKTYAGGSEYVEDGAYQNSIRWDASDELEYEKWKESITKGKEKPKADSSKKKVVKRPDKLNPVWGNFVSKDKNRPPLLYVWEKDNFRAATDMFHLLYEELGDTLPKNHVRVFDKKLGLIYEGNVDECPYGHFPDVQKALVLANNKTATIDTARWQKSLQNLKSIVSENKKKKAILAKETEALKHKVGIDKQSKELVKKQELYLDACNKATWMQHAIFVVNFDTEIVYLKAETVERMLEVGKMWNLNKLFFEQKNRGVLMKSTDKTKQALFMPMVTVEEETNPKIATEQKKMIAEKGYYIDKYYM